MAKTEKRVTSLDDLIEVEEHVTVITPEEAKAIEDKAASGEITPEAAGAMIVELENEAQRKFKIKQSVVFQAQSVIVQVPKMMVERGLPEADIRVFPVEDEPLGWRRAMTVMSDDPKPILSRLAPQFWLQYGKKMSDVEVYKLAELYRSAKAYLDARDPERREQYAFEFGKLLQRFDLHSTQEKNVHAGKRTREGGMKGQVARAENSSDDTASRRACMQKYIDEGCSISEAARRTTKEKGGSADANRALLYYRKKNCEVPPSLTKQLGID